jgi:hypothetical protein
MQDRHDDLNDWLIAEDADRDAADAAFARVMQVLPVQQARADFADVVLAAWQANRRAARRMRAAQLAAIVVFGTLSTLAAIAVINTAGVSLLATATEGLNFGVRVFAAMARFSVRYWTGVLRLNEFTTAVLGSGTVTGGLLTLEAISLFALFSLRRLLRANRHQDRSMEAWT